MGRPRASWLQQVDRHLKEMGMGQASAWDDGQTEAPGVLAESGRSDALLWCLLPYLACPEANVNPAFLRPPETEPVSRKPPSSFSGTSHHVICEVHLLHFESVVRTFAASLFIDIFL